jgi:thymidylate synthase
MAQVTGLTPGAFVHTFGDVHLYANHREQAYEQLGRTPYPLPFVRILSAKRDVFAFAPEDIAFEGYRAHPAIKAPIAV